MQNVELTKRIMRRVYFVHVLRSVLSPLSLKAYAFGLFSVGIVSLVSLSNVIANMPQLGDLAGLSGFLLVAFANTEVAVQLLALGILVAFVLLVRDALNSFRQPISIRI